jgi:hypothetical protein
LGRGSAQCSLFLIAEAKPKIEYHNLLNELQANALMAGYNRRHCNRPESDVIERQHGARKLSREFKDELQQSKIGI